MKIFLWIGIILVGMAFQGSSSNFLEFRGIRPDLPLILVYCTGLLYGEVRGTLSGVGLGLLMDLSSVGPFYQNLVTKSLVGFLAGFLGGRLRHAGPFLHLWLMFGVSFFQGVTVSLFLIWMDEGSLLLDLRHPILPQAFYDAVLGSLILNLFTLRRERRIKERWAGSL